MNHYYFLNHLRNCITAFGYLCKSPIATGLTILVVSIALAVPAGLFNLLHNLKLLKLTIEPSASINIFINDNVSIQEITTLKNDINLLPEILNIEYLPKSQALQEFATSSGHSNLLENLEKNPLPDILIAKINPRIKAAFAKNLLKKIQNFPQVQTAQLDLHWLGIINKLSKFISHGFIVIEILLAFAVILIIGNTTKLIIENQQQEILLNKIIGATDSFIKQKFIYFGFWYGLLGGIFAHLLVAVLLLYANHYLPAEFSFHSITIKDFLLLLTLSSGLGIFGAWLAISSQLKSLQP